VSDPALSVVIPFLNEQGNIPRLVSELEAFFGASPITAEVVFVDDGSTDQSLELLRARKPTAFTARIIKLSRNFGSHSALRAGVLYSRGRRVVFMYADLQDPLDLIPRMWALSEEGFSVVWATREQTQMGFWERLLSRSYASVMQKFAIRDFPDNGFDIVMFGEKVRAELNRTLESNSSIFLHILSFGFRATSISYRKHAREVGKSRWTLARKIKLLVDSFVSFSYAPIRFVTVMGITFSVAGLVWMAYAVLRAILVGDLSPGWPAFIALLTIGFGVTNTSLGIVAEYLWRTLDAARKRPVFIVEEEVEL
jgi:dolichol-phosphate mannosyltransferase